MIVADVSPCALARIAAIVDEVLARSGALGVRPTPLEALRRHAGVERIEQGGLREEVLGALSFEERLLYVRPGQSAPRRTFTEAHELAHALIPCRPPRRAVAARGHATRPRWSAASCCSPTATAGGAAAGAAPREIHGATIVDPRRLAAELDQTRVRGYAIERGEHRDGWQAVAAPFALDPGEIAAITVGGAVAWPRRRRARRAAPLHATKLRVDLRLRDHPRTRSRPHASCRRRTER